MSLSYRKRQLLKEAAQNYHKARVKSSKGWSEKLQGFMVKAGWKVAHPGSDKFTAIKGPIIVKWKGNSWYSANPIRDEMYLYAVLKKLGLAKHIPKVYLYLPEFVVQQYFNDNICNLNTTILLHIDNFHERVKKYGYHFMDVRVENVRLVGNTLKVIDGRCDLEHAMTHTSNRETD